MTGRKPMTKLFIAAALGVTGLLAMTGSAFAGVADYPSTATFGVPNNTGQAGIPSQVFVPPGRTAVQSLQLTKVMPSYGGGGGSDLQLRLKVPSGTEITLLANSAAPPTRTPRRSRSAIRPPTIGRHRRPSARTQLPNGER